MADFKILQYRTAVEQGVNIKYENRLNYLLCFVWKSYILAFQGQKHAQRDQFCFPSVLWAALCFAQRCTAAFHSFSMLVTLCYAHIHWWNPTAHTLTINTELLSGYLTVQNGYLCIIITTCASSLHCFIIIIIIIYPQGPESTKH